MFFFLIQDSFLNAYRTFNKAAYSHDIFISLLETFLNRDRNNKELRYFIKYTENVLATVGKLFLEISIHHLN